MQSNRDQKQEDTYNRAGFRAFIFAMSFSLIFMAYIAFFSKGIDLREIPKEVAAEQTQAEGGAAAPAQAVDVSKVENPWVSSEDLISHGNKVFQTNCAICHGATGHGDGAAGAALNPPPRNLVQGKWTVGGDSMSLFHTIEKGIPGTSMASFGHLPVIDRWSIVHFIHSITENKVADDAAKLEAFGKTAK